MIVILKGQIPSGKNAVLINPRTGRHYPAKRFVEWREQAIRQIRQQYPKGWKIIDKPHEVRVVYTPGDLRRRDAPGMQDAICHLLEKIGIVIDDSLFENWIWVKCDLDRESPSVIISLVALESARPV